eukprot:scaffold4247_cov174-Ochromonas_danica.AAC.2
MANNDLPVDTLSPRHLLVQLVQRLVDSDFLATFEQTHEAMENIDHLMEIFHHGGSSQEEEDNRQLASVPSFSKHSGLSDDCSNQLCHYIEDELSCKGIGFDLKKICARYLLGKMYGCGDYPHAEYDIYNAPSVCLTEYTGFLKILASAAKGNTAAFQSIIEGYLYDANFEEDTCGRRCYQNFQTDSNNFLLSCSKELATHNKSYPLTSYPFQVRIIGYSYSNGTEVLTPETGIPAWPVGSDYTSSTTGNFTYQIYLQNMESSEISTMQAVLKSASLPTLLAAIFHAPTGSVKTSTSIYTWTAGAEPTVLESNGATTSSGRMLTLTIASMIAVVTMTLLR